MPSQRKVMLKAQQLVRTEFRDVPAPTLEEVRKYLADNPRFQAKFPVPEFPGRAQYGSRPLEILGADLIEKDKTTKNAEGNYPDLPAQADGKGKLQRMILVVGDRFTRKVWATSLPGKTNQEVLDGFKELWPEITRRPPRRGLGRKTGGRALVPSSWSWTAPPASRTGS